MKTCSDTKRKEQKNEGPVPNKDILRLKLKGRMYIVTMCSLSGNVAKSPCGPNILFISLILFDNMIGEANIWFLYMRILMG